MKDNIVLIGMPGAGKSTVGVVLAKVLGYRFADTDLLLQEQAGWRLREIIDREGNDGFLRLENDLCANLELSQTVIATGGSVVYGREAMMHLQEIGRVVYLRCRADTLRGRLNDMQQRGVVFRQGQDVEALLAERAPLYEKYAQITVDTDGNGLEKTVRCVVNALNDHEREIGV